jgi:hypothetical protein
MVHMGRSRRDHMERRATRKGEEEKARANPRASLRAGVEGIALLLRAKRRRRRKKAAIEVRGLDRLESLVSSPYLNSRCLLSGMFGK